MSNSLKTQIAALQRRLSKMEVGGSASSSKAKPKKKRKVGNGGYAVVAPRVQRAVVRSGASPQGVMEISREELLVAVVATDKSTALVGKHKIHPSGLAWLKTLVGSFETYQWLSVQIYWKPAVGTNTDGLIVYGMDWNGNAETARDKVQAMTPVSDHPVWQDTRLTPMILPSSRLQSRKFYFTTRLDQDGCPGELGWNCSSTGPANKFYGELWIKYRIRFLGTS